MFLPKIKRSKKAMEMSMGLIVVIVIGLIILAIVIYLVWDKTKQGTAAGKCEAQGGTCKDPEKACDPGFRSSITPCKFQDSKTYNSYCCFPED